MYAWTKRGYALTESDIRFIYDFLYEKRLLWRYKDIKQGIITYQKVKKQSKGLAIVEKDLIVLFFERELLENYKNYLKYNRFTMKIKRYENRKKRNK